MSEQTANAALAQVAVAWRKARVPAEEIEACFEPRSAGLVGAVNADIERAWDVHELLARFGAFPDEVYVDPPRPWAPKMATRWDMARGLAHYQAYTALGLLNNSFSGESHSRRAILADYEKTIAAIDAKESRMARYNAALQGRLHV